jgi:hypothetical protein
VVVGALNGSGNIAAEIQQLVCTLNRIIRIQHRVGLG